jgi:hypothetical protein
LIRDDTWNVGLESRVRLPRNALNRESCRKPCGPAEFIHGINAAVIPAVVVNNDQDDLSIPAVFFFAENLKKMRKVQRLIQR